ncbi:hypothetical protein K443DRAFT_114456 [Laccaria amethystina LaAM-08-1]|uniref:Secreted protein n=1 Tax=Laccaria amethystina LaAM-08-1 TaxID=1095629 RepID=A0A0C9WHV8_9AGAR|nr:hypothetical protein K443DRAFT_114456 [Laccaria amethystina LaAM-08-1]
MMAYVCFWMTLCLFLVMSKSGHKLCPNMDIRCPRHGTRAELHRKHGNVLHYLLITTEWSLKASHDLPIWDWQVMQLESLSLLFAPSTSEYILVYSCLHK